MNKTLINRTTKNFTSKSSSKPLRESMDLPTEIWDSICCKLIDEDDYLVLEPLSLVSTTFLDITNGLRTTLVITDRTVTYLHRYLLRFRNLKRIKFFEFCKEFNPVLLQLSCSGLDLESMDVSLGMVSFPDFKKLGTKMLSNLKELKLYNAWNIGYNDLVSIGVCFPLLEKLDIEFSNYNLRFDYEPGLIILCSNLKALLEINISGFYSLTDKFLVSLSENCVLLRSITFHNGSLIFSSHCIEFVLRNSLKLESLSMNNVWEPSYSFSNNAFLFARCLYKLDLSVSVLSDELLCLIADSNLPLKTLGLSCACGLTFDGILYLLKKYQTLVHLNLKASSFLSDEMVVELGKFLRCLTFLDLSFCDELTGLAFFSIVENCVALKCIRMEGTNFGVEEYSKELDIKSRIKSVYISRNYKLRDECLEKLSRHCPYLETLEVDKCPLITSDGILEVLRNCGELRCLNISTCPGIKNFSALDFELPKLISLRAYETWIDDEDLDIISKRCQRLLHLDLEGCLNVGERGVRNVVQSCIRLKEINLSHCKVDGGIVTWMVSANPSLRRITMACAIPETTKHEFSMRHGCVICTESSDSMWQYGL